MCVYVEREREREKVDIWCFHMFVERMEYYSNVKLQNRIINL